MYLVAENLPINFADFPVGPSNKAVGLRGSVPSFLKMCSAHLETTLIRNVFPTPPPPA